MMHSHVPRVLIEDTATTRRILVGRESARWAGINWETPMFVDRFVAMRSPRIEA
jgi:hypothetical protein